MADIIQITVKNKHNRQTFNRGGKNFAPGQTRTITINRRSLLEFTANRFLEVTVEELDDDYEAPTGGTPVVDDFIDDDATGDESADDDADSDDDTTTESFEVVERGGGWWAVGEANFRSKAEAYEAAGLELPDEADDDGE